MMKKALPAMIGLALAGGVSVAAADVSVFGHIDTSINWADIDGVGNTNNFACTTCSIGFKGSEDLGNGLKAIFSLDFQYDTVNRNNSKTTTKSTTYTTVSSQVITAVTSVKTSAPAITDRDQWLGLSGGFGKVRVGTISTLYKSHGADIDPLYRTALQGRDHGLQSESFHSGAGEELEGRATNTIRWDSADFSGVKVGATYTLDSSKADGESANPYGLGASYENGGMLVFADYMDNARSGVADKQAWKIGGKYDMGLFSFYGQYEDFDDSLSTNDNITLWQVAGGVNNLLGMNMYLGIAHGDNKDTSEDYQAWTFAITHDFSKSTMVYGGVTQVSGCTVGGSAATLSACAPIGAAGTSYDWTSFGMKMKF
jgi:predicted porin